MTAMGESEEPIELTGTYSTRNYLPLSLVIARIEGVWARDESGRRRNKTPPAPAVTGHSARSRLKAPSAPSTGTFPARRLVQGRPRDPLLEAGAASGAQELSVMDEIVSDLVLRPRRPVSPIPP